MFNALSRRICHCVDNSVKLRHTVADLKNDAGIDRNAGSRLKTLAIITGTENKILEFAHDELFFDILDSETDQNCARLTRGNVGKARNGYRLWRRCIDSDINQTSRFDTGVFVRILIYNNSASVATVVDRICDLDLKTAGYKLLLSTDIILSDNIRNRQFFSVTAPHVKQRKGKPP